MNIYLFIYLLTYFLLSIFEKRRDPLGGSTSLPCNDAGFLSRVQSGWIERLTMHFHLVTRLK